MELLLLDFFDWNISVPTSLHFVDYFLMDAVGPHDLHGGKPLTNFDAPIYLERYAQYFLEISLQGNQAFRLYIFFFLSVIFSVSKISLVHVFFLFFFIFFIRLFFQSANFP